VKLDREMIVAALEIIEIQKKRLIEENQQITNGLRPSQDQKMLEWLKQRGVVIEAFSADHGEVRPTLKAIAVEDALETMPLDAESRRVLEIRQLFNHTSIAKYQAAMDRMNDDDYVRGNYIYHGTAPGRFTGHGLQLQNLPWPKNDNTINNYELLVETIKQRNVDYLTTLYGDPLNALANALRAIAIPEKGHKFICMDYKAIQCVLVHWASGDDDALQDFHNKVDPYFMFMSNLNNVPFKEYINNKKKYKDIRTRGKTFRLGCGFGAAPEAIVEAAKNIYGYELSLKDADEGVTSYRKEQYPLVPKMWYALHRKAVAAVRNEGKVFTWNDLVSYQCDGEFLKCELPSGRILHYPKPFVEQAESTTNFKRWNLYYQRVLSKTKQWGEVSAWHGLVTENIIMGIEADIMADSLEDLEAAGYNPGS
jgi:DNA polymerase